MRMHKMLMFLTIAIIAMVFVTAFALRPTAYQRQEFKMRLLKSVPYENEPLSFNGIKLNDNLLALDSEFTANNYWLRDIDFGLQNISGKDIVALEVGVVVRINGRPLPTKLSMNYGELAEVRSGKVTALKIPPYGKVSLKLGDRMFRILEDRLKENDSLSNITLARLYDSFVLFADGTMWVAGSILHPDPQNEGRWVPDSYNVQSPLNSLLNKLKPKQSKNDLCNCGQPITPIELCCQNGGCMVFYQHATLDCNSGNKKCCAVDGPSCDCFPGTYCETCMFVDCDNGSCP